MIRGKSVCCKSCFNSPPQLDAGVVGVELELQDGRRCTAARLALALDAGVELDVQDGASAWPWRFVDAGGVELDVQDGVLVVRRVDIVNV